MISAIAVFPLKTGDSMFVGFDSLLVLVFNPIKQCYLKAVADNGKKNWHE